MFDTVIHSGTVVTATDSFRGDIGIKDGRIAAVAETLSGGERRIDAGGGASPCLGRLGAVRHHHHAFQHAADLG